MALTTGTTSFGKYELIELIGEGGMASVYRAVLSGPGGFRKQVALKQIRPHIAQDEKMVQLLFNEARLGGHLRHKNIVEVYEFDQVDDTYYLAIEFVDGFTLADLLRRGGERGPLPPRIVANVSMQVCQALAYAHAALDDQGRPMRLVHRDLKPANVMVRRDGLVKLADFGIAKAETNVTHTTTGLTRGTPAYMSPEQVTGGRSAPLDHRSDLFSLSAIVAELLTCDRAFDDEQMLDLMNRIASADVGVALDRVARLAPAFLPVLRTAFQRMPVDRFEDAAVMGKEIRRIYDRLPPSEERLSAWLTDWMGDTAGTSVSPDAPTALVGDDALVSPTPGAAAQSPPAATRPSTVVEVTTPPARLPDDARDTLETVAQPATQPAADTPPPGTAAFFGDGEGAPELEQLEPELQETKPLETEPPEPDPLAPEASEPELPEPELPEPELPEPELPEPELPEPDPSGSEQSAAEEGAGDGSPQAEAGTGPPVEDAPPLAKTPEAPLPPRRRTRRPVARRVSSGGQVPVGSVRSVGGDSGEGVPAARESGAERSGGQWVLLVVALLLVLAVPALGVKVLWSPESEPGEGQDGEDSSGGTIAPDDEEPASAGQGGGKRNHPPRSGAGGGAHDGRVVTGGAGGSAVDAETEGETEIPEGNVATGLDVLEKRPRVGICFRRHTRRAGQPRPEVTVSFEVAPNGNVSAVRIERPTDLEEKLATCLTSAIEGAKLPNAAADDPVVRQFTFRRAKGESGD